MNGVKVIFLSLVFPLVAAVAHKYYVSVTQLRYVKEQRSVQIISRINVDDLERTLQERYHPDMQLTTLNEKPEVDRYLTTYLREKLKIKINTKEAVFNFIGKEYDNDLVVCYLEIENVEAIHTIEISNTVLFGLFPEQKNVVKTKINGDEHNLIFTLNEKHQYLNFE